MSGRWHVIAKIAGMLLWWVLVLSLIVTLLVHYGGP
jgi:hypothetical protein